MAEIEEEQYTLSDMNALIDGKSREKCQTAAQHFSQQFDRGID